ncbi:MAG: VWA domain-containing protein [Saprospiraceae bacterium]|nr:VWA domain-containing protein [Saprospiraceae bacterium]
MRIPVSIIFTLIFFSCNYADGFYLEDISIPVTEFNEKYKDYEENPFIKVAEQEITTFALDADGGSYTNSRRFLNDGQTPPKAAVRIEEYLNYFTFDYLDPTDGENVSLESEISGCPWNPDHHLIRLGMKGNFLPLSQIPNSNFVFLIDISGSMASADKLDLLKKGFKTLTDNLRPQDRISIATYAGQAGVILEPTLGSEKIKIKTAIDQLGAGGSTAGLEGIITAYELAEKHFIAGGNNRVILGTDGDFNVGISSTDELIKLIEEKKESGIFLTVLGVGTGNLNETMMEQLADNGNGNYEYIDNVSQIQKVFTHEISKFHTIAKDGKIQVKFNKNMVDSYRLIGYENRSLNNKDFANDAKDAGEIGAGQTITAIYEVDLLDAQKDDTIAHFDFRYKKPNEEVSRLITHTINSPPLDFAKSSENMRFAASIAGFGLIMKQSQYKGKLNKQMVQDMGKNAVAFDPHDYRKEFLNLVKEWKE